MPYTQEQLDELTRQVESGQITPEQFNSQQAGTEPKYPWKGTAPVKPYEDVAFAKKPIDTTIPSEHDTEPAFDLDTEMAPGIDPLGPIKDTTSAMSALIAAKRLLAGTGTPEENKAARENIAEYLKRNESPVDFTEGMSEGSKWVYGGSRIAIENLPFVMAFNVTSPLFIGGKYMARKAAKEALEKLALSKIESAVGKLAARTAVKTAGRVGGTLAQTAGIAPLLVPGQIAENMMPDIQQNPEDDRITVSAGGDTAGAATAKAIGDTWVEVASERMGKPIEELLSPAFSALKQRVLGKWVEKVGLEKVGKALKDFGYNGIPGEILEEEAGKLMRVPLAAAGLSSQEEYKVTTPQELAQQALGFGMMPLGATAVAAPIQYMAGRAEAKRQEGIKQGSLDEQARQDAVAQQEEVRQLQETTPVPPEVQDVKDEQNLAQLDAEIDGAPPANAPKAEIVTITTDLPAVSELQPQVSVAPQTENIEVSKQESIPTDTSDNLQNRVYVKYAMSTEGQEVRYQWPEGDSNTPTFDLVSPASGVEYSNVTIDDFKRQMAIANNEVESFDVQGNRTNDPNKIEYFEVKNPKSQKTGIAKSKVMPLIRLQTDSRKDLSDELGEREIYIGKKRVQTEKDLLKALLSSNEKVSRAAYREGVRNGVISAKLKYRQAKAIAEERERDRKDRRTAIGEIIKYVNIAKVHVKSNRIGKEWAQAILDMVDAYDFQNMRQKNTKVSLFKTMEYVNKVIGYIGQNPDNPTAGLPAELQSELDAMSKKSMGDISTHELKTMAVTASLIYHDAIREKKKYRTAVSRWIKSGIDALVSQMGTPRGMFADVNTKHKVKRNLFQSTTIYLDDIYTVFRRMGGKFSKILDDIIKGEDAALDVRHKMIAKMFEYIDGHNAFFKEWLDGTYDLVSEIIVNGNRMTRTMTLSNPEKLELYMQTFNSNMYRNITDPDKGGIYLKGKEQEGRFTVTEDEMDRLVESISNEEDDFAKFIWNEINEPLYDAVNKVYRLLHQGLDLPREEFYLTAHAAGEAISSIAQSESEQAELASAYGKSMTALDESMTKARSQNPHPIIIGNVIETTYNHIHNMSEYAGKKLPLYYAQSMLRNYDVQRRISANYGKPVLQYINKWLGDYAGRADVTTAPNKVLRFLRQNYTVYQLSLRVSAVLQNMNALALASRWIKNPVHLASGMVSYLSHPKQSEKWFRDNSAFLEERFRAGHHIDLSEPKKFEEIQALLRGKRPGLFVPKGFRDIGANIGILRNEIMSVWSLMDKISVLMVGESVRQKVDSERPELSEQERAKMIIDLTERIIRETQPGNKKTDMPAILRDEEWLRHIAVFYSSTGKIYNVTKGILTDPSLSKTEKAHLMVVMWTLMEIVNVATGVGWNWFFDLFRDDKDKKEKLPWYLGLMGQMARDIAGIVPLARDFTNFLVYKFMYGYNNVDFTTVPLVGFSKKWGDKAFRSPRDFIVSTTDFMGGLLGGIPVERAAKIFGIDLRPKRETKQNITIE